MPDRIDARDQGEATQSWGEVTGALGAAFGGLILALEAAVVIPGLLPGVALAVVLVLPLVVVGAVVAVVVGVPLAAVSLLYRAVRR
jgi:hypothetical protein